MTASQLRLDSAGIADDQFFAVLQPRTATVAFRPAVSRQVIKPSADPSQIFGYGLVRTTLTPEIQPLEPADSSRSAAAFGAAAHRQDPVRPRALPSFADQLADVQVWLGLNKVQLARACRVERQTIYDWFARHYEPVGNNAQRVTQLYRLSVHIRERGCQPLRANVAERPLASGVSLLPTLLEPTLDLARAITVVDALIDAVGNEPPRTGDALRARLGWKPISEEQRQQNLDYNLERLRDR